MMMRSILAVATGLACGLATAAPLAVSHSRTATLPALPTGGARADSILYSQNGTDSGTSIVSQNFESTYDAYDSQAADDFTVGANAKITEVDLVGGYFNGSGPASSFNVTFYKSKNGKPGRVLAVFENLPFVVEGAMPEGVQTFKIAIPGQVPKCCHDSMFVSGQANLDFGPQEVVASGGEWGWESQTTVVGAPAVWRNPGDGFGTGCTTYQTETTCIPNGQGDHMFTIRGKLK